MYQIQQGKEWDTDLWQTLMMHKRISFSKASAEQRNKLTQIGALPHFDNGYDWAMLCISYCFAIGKHLDPIPATDLQSNSGLDFKTCFQKNHKLWLAYISDALFERKQSACTADDLFKYIQDLWHTGALALGEKWDSCRQFKPDSLLEAKQLFLRELTDLAKKNSGSLKQRAESSRKHEAENHINIGEKQLKDALKNMGLAVKQLKFCQQGAREDIYRLSLSKYVDLSRQNKELCGNLGIDVSRLRLKPCTDGEANSYDIFVQRAQEYWHNFDKNAFQAALNAYRGTHLLPICLGIDELGKPFFADLEMAPHLMIGGATGSGKSVFVRSLLHSLFMLNNQQGKIEVAIADGKGGADFKAFTQYYPNIYQKQIFMPSGNDLSSIINMLNEQVDEMNARQELNMQYGALHLSELPNAVRPAYRIVVVDEIGSLLNMEGGKEIENALIQLTAKGRSLGIYVILSTQRPDSQTFKGQLRTNTKARIGLKVSKSSESKIILDETGAEQLLGRGDHFVNQWQDVPNMLFLHGFNL